MAISLDQKIDIKTIIILSGIALSTVVGAVRVLDTQKQIQVSVERSDKLNYEAHREITKRITTLERAQLMQEGYNAAIAKMLNDDVVMRGGLGGHDSQN